MKRSLDKTLGGLLVFLMAIMVLAVLWQVFSRYVIQSPSSITEELARYLLIWIGLLGAAYASGQQMHLAIDLLSPKLNERNRIRLRMFINWLIIAFCFFILVIGGGNLVYIDYILGQSSAALDIPLWFIYLAIPVSGVLVITYKVNELLNPKKYLV